MHPFPGRALPLIAGLWASAAAAGEPRVEKVTPGPGYSAGWFGRILLGEQWRDLWTTPIEVPVLDLETFDGGLRPTRTGGGLQTKNLRLKSGNRQTWVFRSVDKDVSGLLDPDTRRSIFGDVLQDLTSTIHPGGALVVAPLLEAAGVLHPHPQLAVMPDDPRLGEFRPTFANMLGLLEERMEPGDEGSDKVQSTLDVFVRLDTRTKEEVDARNYLRARLIDILVGDWDRHLDQWKWARFELDDGRRVWRPIPHDRDQAFSRFGGIIPSVGEYYTKQLAGLGEGYAPMDKLTFSGRFTDRRFLVWLDRAAWEAETADLVGKLTDEVIAGAVRRLPAAMYAKGGAELERLLRGRRDRLERASRDYYGLLAGKVDLRAAEGEEIHVRRQPSGIEVSTPRFRRVFIPDETSELRVYTPRGGRVVEDGSDGGIDVRVVPPDPREAEAIRERYEPVRDWGRDLLFFPLLSYDSTRGLFPGVRADLTSYGFELQPYAWRMDFAAAWATAVSRPRLQYNAEFRTRSPLSVLVSLGYSGVEVLNFFGFGNDTVRDDALSSSGFYNVRQEQLAAFPALELGVTGPLRAYAGVPIKHVSALQGSGTAASGLYGSAAMTVAGFEAGLMLDTLAGALTARRGFRFRLAARHTPAIFGSTNPYTKVHASANASFGGHLITDLFLDLHAAAEKNWGTYPFFDAVFLGGASLPVPLNLTSMGGIPLLGFDANRFAGDSAVGGNAQLRIAIGRFLALLPFRYGIAGLADVGRVFISGESSSRWHNSFGAGLWLAVFAAGPGLQLATSMNALIVRSDEGTSFYFSTGFGL